MRVFRRLGALLLALGCASPLAARAGQLDGLEHEMGRPQGSRSDDWHDDADEDACHGFFECFFAVIFAGPAEGVVRGTGAAAGEAVDWALFGPQHDEDREWLGTAAGQAAPPIPPQDPSQAVPLPERREPPAPPPAPMPPAAAARPERRGGPGATNRYGGERAAGSSTIPYLRVDNGYLLVPDDVDGYALQAQAGYGAFAAGFEFLRLWEDQPASRLDSYSADAVFRFAAGEVLELDIVTGYRGFRGEESHDGWEIGVPIAIYPWRYLGVEASFRWAFVAGNVVDDYRAGVALHLPFVTLRPGYRHLATGDESLDAAEFTLGVMW